jgi:hypothetical protein
MVTTIQVSKRITGVLDTTTQLTWLMVTTIQVSRGSLKNVKSRSTNCDPGLTWKVLSGFYIFLLTAMFQKPVLIRASFLWIRHFVKGKPIYSLICFQNLANCRS